MTDRPILFQPTLVRAILDGRKTQTRRILNPQPPGDARYTGIHYASYEPASWFFNASNHGFKVRQSFEEGDELWVRETYSGPYECRGSPPREWDPTSQIWYWADGNPCDGDWTKPKPGIHMPRWASRLTLIVTDVRVERVQAISEEDARSEGCPISHNGNAYDPPPAEVDSWQGYARASFMLLWSEINGAASLKANPWVVAVTFRVEKRNVDEAAAV